MERRYSDEEVRAILDMALKRDNKEGVGHDELLAAAAEVGISREAIDAAARELDAGRGERQAREAILARRRKGLSAHLWPFVAVNVFLLAINMLTTPGYPWFFFPLLAWGLGLFFHARAALSKEVSPRAIAREFERGEKQRKRDERRARKERLHKTAQELGAAVEDGVEELLTKLTREVRGTGPRVAPPQDQVRVDARPEDDELLDEIDPPERRRQSR
jgi:hypothetical protein